MIQEPNDDKSWTSEKLSPEEDSSIAESCAINTIETEDSDYSDFSFSEKHSGNETFKSATSADDISLLENYTDQTVTVKFHVNYEDKTDELFTKAFNRNVTVETIKSELTSLLQIPQHHITIEKDDRELYDDVSLAKLGVPVLGTIELHVKLTPVSACRLDKDLIYGHMPTLDVITVRVQQNKHLVKHLVVEIEDEQSQKPWLGGYRHRTTRAEYHHAQTQTYSLKAHADNAYVTRSTQATTMETRHTNTSTNKSVQISPFMFSIPSQTDRIVTSKLLQPSTTFEHESERISEVHNTAELPEKISTEYRGDTTRSPAHIDPIRMLKPLRDEIEKWNATQNALLNNSPNDRETATQRTLIINQTVKFINRLNQFKSKLFLMQSSDQSRLFDKYTKPHTFASKTGSKVSIQTVFNQKAKKLKDLYVKYSDNSIKEPEKIQVIRDMINFFKQTASADKFSVEIVSILEEQIDLLDRGLGPVKSLHSRVHQRICHFLQYAGSGLNDGYDEAELQTNYKVQPIFTTQAVLKMDVYWNLLSRLRNDEFQTFQSFKSVCFKMTPVEFTYLIRNIWNDTPVTDNDHKASDTNRWVVTRWNVREEWTPWNCILLTKPYLTIHLKADNAERCYDASVLSTVINNHLKAKIHFQKLLVKNVNSLEL